MRETTQEKAARTGEGRKGSFAQPSICPRCLGTPYSLPPTLLTLHYGALRHTHTYLDTYTMTTLQRPGWTPMAPIPPDQTNRGGDGWRGLDWWDSPTRVADTPVCTRLSSLPTGRGWVNCARVTGGCPALQRGCQLADGYGWWHASRHGSMWAMALVRRACHLVCRAACLLRALLPGCARQCY